MTERAQSLPAVKLTSTNLAVKKNYFWYSVEKTMKTYSLDNVKSDNYIWKVLVSLR